MSTKINKTRHPKLYELRGSMTYFKKHEGSRFPSDFQVKREAADLIASLEVHQAHRRNPRKSQVLVSDVRKSLYEHYLKLNLADLEISLTFKFMGRPMLPVA